MSTLVIPIDASQIPESDRKQQRVKVVVKQKAKITSHVAAIDGGKAEVKLDVDAAHAITVAIGSDKVADADIFDFQTLAATVSVRQWGDKKVLTLPAFVVTPAWWLIWLRWCRDFVITGRVVCPDGSPVPGAEVQALDVDFFWWWSSAIPVGPTVVTDATGHFTIPFRWCCGLWLWRWWAIRQWRLDSDLFNKIHPIVALNPELKVPPPGPTPVLDFGIAKRDPALPAGDPMPLALAGGRLDDPGVIATARDKVVAVLPAVPELERLRIWPWWPWTPWLDCNPDVIFRVTQSCGGLAKVIVNENVFQTRWDIPTSFNVTLIANQQACCLPPPHGDPDGDCALFTGVCGDPGIVITDIGGNSGALPAPAGYALPGDALHPAGRDRPFSEYISLSGQFGSSAQADYYEIEHSPHSLNLWTPVPGPALLPFTRGYFDGTPLLPNPWFYPTFPLTVAGGHSLYESRHHYEVRNPPANWGSPFGRTWFSNVNVIAAIQTAGTLSDGTYDFRIVGYQALPNGQPDLNSRKVLDGCGDHPESNRLVLTIDNRVVGPPAPNSVHVSTTEPDCGITGVRLNGTAVAACGSQQLKPGTPLDIDFFASDPDGHLDHYELVLKYDLGTITNLLGPSVGSATLSPLGAGVSVGPDYADVVVPAPALRPVWKGGAMTLHIDDASLVFPKTCCYLIQLTVWKRNIVGCDGHLSYYNQIHYSFTVTV